MSFTIFIVASLVLMTEGAGIREKRSVGQFGDMIRFDLFKCIQYTVICNVIISYLKRLWAGTRPAARPSCTTTTATTAATARTPRCPAWTRRTSAASSTTDATSGRRQMSAARPGSAWDGERWKVSSSKKPLKLNPLWKAAFSWERVHCILQLILEMPVGFATPGPGTPPPPPWAATTPPAPATWPPAAATAPPHGAWRGRRTIASTRRGTPTTSLQISGSRRSRSSARGSRNKPFSKLHRIYFIWDLRTKT